jgi:hypothetical protein
MAQLNLKGVVSEVYYSAPDNRKEESTYITIADAETGGLIKLKFAGKTEVSFGQFLEGVATVRGQVFGKSLVLYVISYTFKNLQNDKYK